MHPPSHPSLLALCLAALAIVLIAIHPMPAVAQGSSSTTTTTTSRRTTTTTTSRPTTTSTTSSLTTTTASANTTTTTTTSSSTTSTATTTRSLLPGEVAIPPPPQPTVGLGPTKDPNGAQGLVAKAAWGVLVAAAGAAVMGLA